MGKRAGEPIAHEGDALKSGRRPQKQGDEAEAVEFEDEYDDEYETEDELVEAEAEEHDEGEQQGTDFIILFQDVRLLLTGR